MIEESIRVRGKMPAKALKERVLAKHPEEVYLRTTDMLECCPMTEAWGRGCSPRV